MQSQTRLKVEQSLTSVNTFRTMNLVAKTDQNYPGNFWSHQKMRQSNLAHLQIEKCDQNTLEHKIYQESTVL